MRDLCALKACLYRSRCSRGLRPWPAGVAASLMLAFTMTPCAPAQTSAQTQAQAQEQSAANAVPPAGAPGIATAWDELLGTGVPQAQTDPVLVVPQAPAGKSGPGDFINHFFFETRTDYWRYSTDFTGLPTTSGVINAPDTGVFNPAGIPYSPAYQPAANRVESFLDFGTRGWLSNRINTLFALRYYQDTTHVDTGAPAQNITETFNANRSFQWLTAAMEINGLPTDGLFANTTLTLGRQDVYGAELAELDGAAFTIRRPFFDLELYGGRRFSLFTDPDQRGIGGANLTIRLSPNSSLGIETLWYIKGSNSISYRRRVNSRWLFNTYLRSYGGSPVDFSAQGIYSDRDARTTLRMSFFQKLSNNDYTYDYTVQAADQDPHNPLLRLYLGQIAPYSQFAIDVRRTLLRTLRAGASVTVRHLNSSSDQGPFDTSFQDYRANAQWFPRRKLETFFEYHERDSDRLGALNATTFDDIRYAGETSVKDLTADVRRSFGEGRFNLSGGVYYRRISTQDRFFLIEGAHQSGWLASGWVKLDSHTRLIVDYDLDNDFFVFAPSIQNSRALHIGLNWKY